MKAPPRTTPPADRYPLDRNGMVEHCLRHGMRIFRAGEAAIYAILPGSAQQPSPSSWEVTPQEGAQFIFEEFKWEGQPILEPYVSGTYPSRMGFRYTEKGRAYRAEKRRLNRGRRPRRQAR